MRDQLLWESLYARDFKESYKKLKDNGSLLNVDDWKQEYANMYKRSEPKTSGIWRPINPGPNDPRFPPPGTGPQFPTPGPGQPGFPGYFSSS